VLQGYLCEIQRLLFLRLKGQVGHPFAHVANVVPVGVEQGLEAYCGLSLLLVELMSHSD